LRPVLCGVSRALAPSVAGAQTSCEAA